MGYYLVCNASNAIQIEALGSCKYHGGFPVVKYTDDERHFRRFCIMNGAIREPGVHLRPKLNLVDQAANLFSSTDRNLGQLHKNDSKNNMRLSHARVLADEWNDYSSYIHL